MTLDDRNILFTALAYVLVVMKEGSAPNDMTAQISQYVGRIEALCTTDSSCGLLSANARDTAEETDRMIERHVRELKQREETHLSENCETLMRLHDRLQHRKVRREARAFYASANEEELADAVLRLLDKEIVAAGDLRVA